MNELTELLVPQYSRSAAFPCPAPYRDNAHITQAANAIVKRIYKSGFKYAKAGVMLMDLKPATREQLTLDLDETMPENRTCLMLALDQLNQSYGRGTLSWPMGGAEGHQAVGDAARDEVGGVYDGLAGGGGGGLKLQ